MDLPVDSNVPPGVVPNFDHPQSRVIELRVALSVCVGVALVFVILRLYVKLVITKLWGWEDWACLMGFALMIAVDVMVCTTAQPGKPLGIHSWETRLLSLKKEFIQSILVHSILFFASTFLIKLSLFLLCLRLFKPQILTRWLIYGGILACGLVYSAWIIISCALYIPRPGEPDTDFAWMMRSFKVNDAARKLVFAQSVFGTVSDIYLLVIPIRSIFQLQLPFQRKLEVSSIFMIGIIAIICSIGNVYYRSVLLRSTDITWYLVPVYNFSAAEISAGIVCSCMPILKALFPHRASKKSPSASLIAFFTTRFLFWNSFRRPFLSDRSHSFDRLCPDQIHKNLSSGEEPTSPRAWLSEVTIPHFPVGCMLETSTFSPASRTSLSGDGQSSITTFIDRDP